MRSDRSARNHSRAAGWAKVLPVTVVTSAIGTGPITCVIEGKDRGSNTYWRILTGAPSQPTRRTVTVLPRRDRHRERVRERLPAGALPREDRFQQCQSGHCVDRRVHLRMKLDGVLLPPSGAAPRL